MGWLSEIMQNVSWRKRQKRPSTYELRMCLSNLAETERDETYVRDLAGITERSGRAYKLAHLNLGLTLTDRAIEGYKRDTLLAVLEASKHPSYSLLNTMRGDDKESNVRGTALFFGAMEQLGIKKRRRSLCLMNLSLMTGASDVSVLHRRSPEGAEALLRVVHHVIGDSVSLTDIEPMRSDLLELVMNHPEKADALIEFIDQRRGMSLADLHPQVFLDAMNTRTQSMRDGVL